MASIIRTDALQNLNTSNIISQTNATTLTLGYSGQTIAVASGATLLGGGITWTSNVVTSAMTVAVNTGYFVNTSSNAITVTLPASASVGNTIILSDFNRTWATNNLTLSTNALNFQGNTSPNPVYNTNGQTVQLVYSGATKGWIPTSDDDVTLQTPQSYSIDFLVVAGGGGGGGGAHGGGGGAGGYRTSTQGPLSKGVVITVTVGDGGSGGNNNIHGVNGNNSSISGTGLTTITSTAGGGGGSQGAATGNTGGSGGGAGNSGGPGTGGAGNTPSTSPSQGNNGGDGNYVGPNYPTGGGGGASSNGGTASGGTTSGNGGAGTASSITGSSVTRAGGGGGANYGGGTAGSGGAGGGGAGGVNGNGTAGTANTGGGGGGGANTSDTGVGGAGGKGVVILSVPTASYSGTTTGSPTVTTSGSNTIMQFNGSGSYTT
jgi:hypothetical protein